MRVLVCGGRDFSDYEELTRVLDDFHKRNGINLLIQGGQRSWDNRRECWIGADWLAGEWARLRELACVRHPARWNLHGRAAGPIRNRHMLEDWRPEVVIAFPGGRGTGDMITQAIGRGVKVLRAE